MKILVTNDDGIAAPGIAALAAAVADLGDVTVVAPEAHQSATGHAISILKALRAERRRIDAPTPAWCIDGRPADCVKIAVHSLLDHRPDVVLSGINSGVNTGTNVFYSGTLAAAIEATFFGIPSIAFSLELSEEMDYVGAGRIAREIVIEAMSHGPAGDSCLSVNIPSLSAGPPRGVKVCRQSLLPMEDRYHRAEDPRGRPVFWLDGLMPSEPSDAETDLRGVHDRYVTITPLRADLTDFERMGGIAAIDWRLPG